MVTNKRITEYEKLQAKREIAQKFADKHIWRGMNNIASIYPDEHDGKFYVKHSSGGPMTKAEVIKMITIIKKAQALCDKLNKQ